MTRTPSRPFTVLIIDDDPDLRLYVRGCLQYFEPDHIAEVSDSRTALPVAYALQPTLVILGAGLRGPSVPSLCRALKADERTRHALHLFIGNEEDDNALPTSADAFLTKPFNARGLREAILPLLTHPGVTSDLDL